MSTSGSPDAEVTPVTILAVAVGGFVGAPARFVLDRRISDRWERDFPLGTFIINVSGSAGLGLVVGLRLVGVLPAAWEAFFGTGFCGAFTTFSTWSFETVRLLEEGENLQATLNVAVSIVVGLIGAGVGLALGLAF